MDAEKRYRFGSIYLSLKNIEDIAYRHGSDLIMFYPPNKWGAADLFTVCSIGELCKTYEFYYREGRRKRLHVEEF